MSYRRVALERKREWLEKNTASYEVHSLSMLRRVAGILGAEVHVEIRPAGQTQQTAAVAEKKTLYGTIARKK